MNNRQPPSTAAARPASDPALPSGSRLGAFEIQRVLARNANTVVYLATDHALVMPVAIQEYLPARWVLRDAGLRLQAIDPGQEGLVARGLRAFFDEARMLAHCDHPALIRVLQLLQANGTAYRVTPYYNGQRLVDRRRELDGAPDEASLRVLLDGLLGALDAIHQTGQVHGGVTPASILLLADDRPLLLGPGDADVDRSSDLIDSLMASLAAPGATAGSDDPSSISTSAVAGDLHALAEVVRFCITGLLPAPLGSPREREPLATAVIRSFDAARRPSYSHALLSTLDAASSPSTEDRPVNAAQFREWLQSGVPRGRGRSPPRAEFDSFETWPTAEAARSAPAPLLEVPHAQARPAAALPVRPEPTPWPLDGPAPAPGAAAVRRKALGRLAQMALFGAALLTGGVIVVALVTGAWEPAVSLPLDRPAAAGVTGVVTPAPEPALAPAVTPAPNVSATPVDTTADPATPASSEAAPDAPRATADAPGPKLGAAATRAGSPRMACAPRKDFALYRCVQALCETPRWSRHAQCVNLRSDGTIE